MILEIKNLYKVFSTDTGEEVVALSGLNLIVKEGEFICVLGPSGCGKTTLLRVIGGLEKATSGQVTLNGHIIDKPSPDMAMIFQEYSLYPWRTVIDNVAFGLEVRGIPRGERYRIADEYLALIGLTSFRKSQTYELSGGMRQRVAVARALAIDPQVLLMDEPFGALDAQTRNRMQIELLLIWEKTHKTVVFVTHSVDEAVFMADRVVVLTRRPARVKEIVEIPTARPRERTDRNFVQIRRHVLDLLAEESTPTQ